MASPTLDLIQPMTLLVLNKLYIFTFLFSEPKTENSFVLLLASGDNHKVQSKLHRKYTTNLTQQYLLSLVGMNLNLKC